MEVTEDQLLHYGVKGMRWGVRKKTTASSEKEIAIAKLEKKLNRISADDAVAGSGYRGHYAQKLYNKQMKKEPSFDYKKLSPKEQQAYQNKITRKAVNGVIANGLVETGLMLGGANYIMTRGMKREASKRGKIQVNAFILGGNAIMRGMQIKAIHSAVKLENIQKELETLRNS